MMMMMMMTKPRLKSISRSRLPRQAAKLLHNVNTQY